MKKFILSMTFAFFTCGYSFAIPIFKGLNNYNGKTTIKIEIPASDRDASNGLSIDNVRLYNNGEMLQAKKVDALWGENATIILEFKKLKTFEDCTLSFTINGEAVCMDIQNSLLSSTPQTILLPKAKVLLTP